MSPRPCRTGIFNGVSIPGYFGRVTEDTHYLYKAYPCVAVYAQAVLADLEYTENRYQLMPRNDPDPEGGEEQEDEGEEIEPDALVDAEGMWDLPHEVNARIEGANYPTENLLGYRRAKKLSPSEVSWLHENARTYRYDFPMQRGEVAFNLQLLNAVDHELSQVESLKLEPLSEAITGSIGQLLWTEVTEIEPIIETESQILVHSPQESGGTIANLAGAFRYRPFHRIRQAGEYADIAAWSIYGFNRLRGVPRAWYDTANRLTGEEYDEMWKSRYVAPPFSPSLRIHDYVVNDKNVKR